MFASLTLGSHTRITDASFDTDKADLRLCRSAKAGRTANTTLTQNPKELIGGEMGIKSKFYKESFEYERFRQ